jgi:hypothetical protein
MDSSLQQRFSEQWNKFFDRAELPIAFYYSDDAACEQLLPPKSSRCVIADLARVRSGTDLCLNAETTSCGGGKRYLGFVQEMRPNFEYFLSCGIPGEMEGERYKKTPEIVKEHMAQQLAFAAPARYIAFKRWDRLGPGDDPIAVVFFAPPDVLSGLYTLAGYDESDPNAVVCPFGSGCSSIIYYPYHEAQSERPRAVLGMFDVSARPYVPSGALTFSVPWPKFVRMVDNMEESFLTTQSWSKVRARIAGS